MLSPGAKPLKAVAYFIKALDRVNDVDEHRSHLLDTLLQLAVSSGVVPKCLHVRGVKQCSSISVRIRRLWRRLERRVGGSKGSTEDGASGDIDLAE